MGLVLERDIERGGRGTSSGYCGGQDPPRDFRKTRPKTTRHAAAQLFPIDKIDKVVMTCVKDKVCHPSHLGVAMTDSVTPTTTMKQRFASQSQLFQTEFTPLLSQNSCYTAAITCPSGTVHPTWSDVYCCYQCGGGHRHVQSVWRCCTTIEIGHVRWIQSQ